MGAREGVTGLIVSRELATGGRAQYTMFQRTVIHHTVIHHTVIHHTVIESLSHVGRKS